MIFPLEVDYLKWSQKYQIRILNGNCPECGRGILTNIPFAIQGYRGLKSEDHGCGEKFTKKVLVPVEKEEIEYWANFAQTM